MLALGVQHKPSEWPLFIDKAKLSLKVVAVLLHNGIIIIIIIMIIISSQLPIAPLPV